MLMYILYLVTILGGLRGTIVPSNNFVETALFYTNSIMYNFCIKSLNRKMQSGSGFLTLIISLNLLVYY